MKKMKLIGFAAWALVFAVFGSILFTGTAMGEESALPVWTVTSNVNKAVVEQVVIRDTISGQTSSIHGNTQEGRQAIRALSDMVSAVTFEPVTQRATQGDYRFYLDFFTETTNVFSIGVQNERDCLYQDIPCTAIMGSFDIEMIARLSNRPEWRAG